MPTEPNPNLATVRNLYAALNTNDIPTIVHMFDPRIERVEFEGTPSGGTYRGIAEVETHFSRGRATWAEGSCEPERLIAAGDKVVVLVHVRVRKRGSAAWNEGRVGDVFTFRGGKIIEMRSFMNTDDALAWAGVKAPR